MNKQNKINKMFVVSYGNQMQQTYEDNLQLFDTNPLLQAREPHHAKKWVYF